jgi:2-polyprenyl-3-methyl-5-hydroxy-6-metoxy-1,4-benzoquinol methylase
MPDTLVFDLKGISSLRGHATDGLEEGYCELDPQSLQTMREVYGSDAQAQAMVDLYERRLVYGRVLNKPRLHAEALASILALVRMSKPRSVLDLGCGVGLLTRTLAREKYISRVVGADIAEKHVRVAEALLPTEPLPHRPSIEMRRLDVTSALDRKAVKNIDFVALSEVVQQIADKDWISNVFELNPKILVVTTPNRDFNAIYPSMLLCENGLRDPEHVFEFTQNELIKWAMELAVRHDYSVDVLPLGPADSVHGPGRLMAVFQRTPNKTGSLLEGAETSGSSSIVEAAIDPLQYDRDEVLWDVEGSLASPNRRLFLDYLRPWLHQVRDKRVVDIGCGYGWLCNEIAGHGGRPLGLDPSHRCIDKAHSLYPNLELRRVSLQSFHSPEDFDEAYMVMVDNFLDLRTMFSKIRQVLKPGGELILIVGDFERSLAGNDHNLEFEVVSEDTVAIRIECPERFGVICDIVHPLGSYIQAAQDVGLNLEQHTNVTPKSWHPRHKTHEGKPLFHLLQFSKNGGNRSAN